VPLPVSANISMPRAMETLLRGRLRWSEVPRESREVSGTAAFRDEGPRVVAAQRALAEYDSGDWALSPGKHNRGNSARLGTYLET